MFGIAVRTPETDVWTAQVTIEASVRQVLTALTDPDAIAAWAPVSFEVEGLAGPRLRSGSRERVTGTLAGFGTTFDVEVHRADERGLQLTARGPVQLEVDYTFTPGHRGVTVDASVRLARQRGLSAQVLRAAVAALMHGGALGSSLRRLQLALSYEWCPEPALLAA